MVSAVVTTIRGDSFITFADRGRGVEELDHFANAVREVAWIQWISPDCEQGGAKPRKRNKWMPLSKRTKFRCPLDNVIWCCSPENISPIGALGWTWNVISDMAITKGCGISWQWFCYMYQETKWTVGWGLETVFSELRWCTSLTALCQAAEAS